MITRTSISFQTKQIKEAADARAKKIGKRSLSAYIEDLILTDLKKEGILLKDLQNG